VGHNTKRDLKYILCEDVNRFHLAPDIVQWQAPVNIVTKLWPP
jgi:hypothetical protein